MIQTRSILAWLAGALLAAATCGCSSYGALCEAAAECNRANELDIEACVNDLETEAEVASIYGCDEEWDLLIICIEDEGRCDDDDYRAERCDDEAEDYSDCVN
jgi:hypothetical protein